MIVAMMVSMAFINIYADGTDVCDADKEPVVRILITMMMPLLVSFN